MTDNENNASSDDPENGVLNYDPELYTDEEFQIVSDFIEGRFGTFENVMHELVSSDIHLDVAVIDPSEGRDYITLCTMGMGAHRMNVPPEFGELGLERAELLIRLPSDWKVHDEDDRWYWPTFCIKSAARLPIDSDTWLGWGHSVEFGSFDGSVGFEGIMLINPDEGELVECALPDGGRVLFYQVVPLYREELDFKIKNDAEKLLKRFATEPHAPLDISRENYGKKKGLFARLRS